MTPLRRRAPDLDLERVREGFRRVTFELDSAQRRLLSAVPTSRDPGTPLPQALDEFLNGIANANAAMHGWRTDRTKILWRRCAQALDEARGKAETLRASAASERLGFEALNARLGDIVAPLEEFADAAAEIRRLR